jgi:release factor glutamine methyltransferase
MYRIIAGRMNAMLNPGGKIYFEVGKDQAIHVESILRKNGIEKIRMIKDLQGIDRIVVGEKE